MLSFAALVILEVAFMLSVWESTCEIEQTFTIKKMLNTRQKASTKTSSLRSLIKILSDGPPAESDVLAPMKQVNGKCVYEVTPLVRKAQAVYRAKFGSRKPVKAELPRREVQSRLKKTGKAAFLRRRQSELCELSKASSSSCPDTKIDELSTKTTSVAKTGEKGKAYTSLLATLHANGEKKRKLIEALAQETDPEAARKLEEAKKQEVRDAQVMLRHDLQQVVDHRLDLQTELVAIVLIGAPSYAQDKILAKMGAKLYKYEASKSLVDPLVRRFRHIIWCPTSAEAESGLTNGKEFGGIDSGHIMMSRLLGGFVGGPEWLAACFEEDKILMPVLKLDRALAKPVELLVDASVNFKAVLDMTLDVASKIDTVKWTVREKRAELHGTQSPQHVVMLTLSDSQPCCHVLPIADPGKGSLHGWLSRTISSGSPRRHRRKKASM